MFYKKGMKVIIGGFFLGILAGGVTGCFLFRPSVTIQPLASHDILQDPFSYEPSLSAFQERYKRLSLTKDTLHNRYVQGRIDTLYHLRHKGTQLSFYQRADGRRLFYNAIITSPQLPLRNGVQIGMPRSEFKKCFSDVKHITDTSLSIQDKENRVVHRYHFDKEELTKIEVQHYID